MKKLFLILSIVWWATPWGTAQTKNVDIDNVSFYYAYRLFPTQPRDPIQFAYTARVHAGSVAKNHLNLEELEAAFYIAGQTRTTDESEAQMQVEMTMGDIVIASSNVSERKQEVKSKDGKVTTYYYYRVVVVYSFDSSYRFLAGEEVLEDGNIFSRPIPQTFSTQEYDSRKQAVDYWNNNREVLVASFYTDHAMKTVREVSGFASSQFGFPEKKDVRYTLKTIDEKKHNENTAFRTAVDTLKALLQATTPDELPDRERLNSLIDYFKSIPAKYTDPKLKADVRLRYAAYYNLCALHYYMDEPEKVAEYADLLIANGYDTRDGERMKKDAAALQKQFDTTGIRTRHFHPESYFQNTPADS
ncbi:MAG: hypothetical protein LBP56_10270 [Odoribacteraceae bacterium]|jgi:hypothetical protein|nr:hypothetical protein [Odoribacteraceae bacterium]